MTGRQVESSSRLCRAPCVRACTVRTSLRVMMMIIHHCRNRSADRNRRPRTARRSSRPQAVILVCWVGTGSRFPGAFPVPAPVASRDRRPMVRHATKGARSCASPSQPAGYGGSCRAALIRRWPVRSLVPSRRASSAPSRAPPELLASASSAIAVSRRGHRRRGGGVRGPMPVPVGRPVECRNGRPSAKAQTVRRCQRRRSRPLGKSSARSGWSSRASGRLR